MVVIQARSFFFVRRSGCNDHRPAQVKRTDQDQFLFECSTKDSNSAVITRIVRASFPHSSMVLYTRVCCLKANIWNMRERIGRVTGACEELAKHGPAKPEAERGLDEVGRCAPPYTGAHCYCTVHLPQLAEREGKSVPKGPFYCADPLGNRRV